MARRLRAFRKDFLDQLHASDAWPKEVALRAWLQTTSFGGIRNGVCRSLGSGRPHSEKDLTKIVAYLRQSPLPGIESAINRYLAGRTLSPSEDLYLERMVELVSEPADTWFVDSFMEGLRLVRDIYEHVRHPETCVHLCPHENDVREAVRWMFIHAGRLLSKAELTVTAAILKGEAQIGISLEDYQNRAVAWWRAEPWTVIMAWGYRKTAGMSIALPVREDVYEQVRRGDRRSYCCPSTDLKSPSSSILVEGMAMRPPEQGCEAEGINLRLVAAMLCQHAHLTDVPDIGQRVPLRLLAPGGTPKSCARLSQFGYRPTGSSLHGTKIPLFERTLLTSKKREWNLWGIWKGLQEHTRSIPTPTSRSHL